ncbi:MAG: sulfurtransferase [Bacteroidetes bacterium HGW-Bacteroidetes-11]|nr:MAG: sulfurtransferase [Bacteroidetes bacterium HGW-Bacteroidetes-11]
MLIFSENFGFNNKTGKTMGPLIPQGFVNPDLNLFFAFVIGLGFGYVLEQAGFSTSRKLAGVFYGYDFVVLRVFFTAAITAALGLLIFSYIGWIDYSMIYINPTFLWSAIVGGAIMGVGFILGGFCPGTSLVAAVIGKVDAMLFIIGMMIGIFVFGQFYNTFEPLYMGSDLGGIFVYDSLGMSRDWFVFFLVVIALAAFIITRKIEDKVNGLKSEAGLFHPSYTAPFALMFGLAILILILPESPKAKWYEANAKSLLEEAAAGKQYIEAEEVTYKLLHQREMDLLLVDVRPEADFLRFSLPGSVNVPLDRILDKSSKKLLSGSDNRIVFYSFGSTAADQAWLLTRRSGIKNSYVLKDGLNGLFASVFQYESDSLVNNEMSQFRDRFFVKAGEIFEQGGAIIKTSGKPSPVRTLVDIQPPVAGKGGC